MEREILEFEISAVTQNLWQVLLGLDLESCPEGTLPPTDQVIVSTIRLSGAWQGEIAILTSPRLARRIAETMFRGVGRALTTMEFEDAMREVANITGGNLKNVVPEGTELSLPELAYTTWLEWSSDHEAPFISQIYSHDNERYAVFISKRPGAADHFQDIIEALP